MARELGLKAGSWATVIAFFGGVLLMALIDKWVPSEENPHSMYKIEEIDDPDKIEDLQSQANSSLLRTGKFTALAVGIHNFPEGLATFIAALQDPSIAIPIAVAIAIHNIPEGIAVSVPVYYATGDKKKAFIYSFMSGLSEPIGALVGYLILMPFINDFIFGIVFCRDCRNYGIYFLDELLLQPRSVASIT